MDPDDVDDTFDALNVLPRLLTGVYVREADGSAPMDGEAILGPTTILDVEDFLSRVDYCIAKGKKLVNDEAPNSRYMHFSTVLKRQK